MKKSLYIFLLLVSIQLSNSKENFSIKPILINFYGSCGKDSTIIAFGDKGNAIVTYNNANSWETIKIFESGDIVEMFYEESRIVAITKDGQIAVSYDNAKSWEYLKNLDFTNFENDTLFYYFKIIQTNNGYFIRKKNYIFFLNLNFELIKTFYVPLPDLIFLNHPDSYNGNSMIWDNDFLLVPKDTFLIYKLSKDLKIIDSINLKGLYNYDCIDCYYNYEIFADIKYYYFKMHFDFFKVDKNNLKNIEKLKTNSKNIRISNIFNRTLIFNKSYYLDYYKLNNGDSLVTFLFNNDYYYKISKDQITATTKYRKETLINNKLIITDTYNRLFIATLNTELDSVIDFKTLSCASYRDPEGFQIKKIQGINELVTTYSYGENSLSNDMTTINVNSNLFTPIVKRGNSNNYKDTNSPFNYLVNGEFPVHFVDKENGNIYAGGIISGQNESDVYVSKDKGYIFERIKIPINTFTYPYKTQSLKENTNNDLIFHLKGKNFKFHVSEFLYFDKNLNYKYKSTLNNTNAIYYESLDTNNYLFLDKFDNKLSFKSTTDKGENWEVYKEYPNTTNLLESKELEFNGKKIWAYTYYDFVTSQFNLDVIDVEDRKIYNVYQSQLTQDQIDSIDYIGFDAAKEKFYLSFYNTLMVSNNIFEDNIKWETFNYPNNGKVNKKFQVFDKTIFARYEDDKNEDNVYWINGIEMVGDPTSVENNSQIEEVSYLYTMPPYPNPTISEVTAKFYWDRSIDIDNSEIAVYDITGNKVSGKESLTLEKLNEWSGNIKWNCIGQPKGTYLIKIEHGNNTKTMKVVVN